MSAKTKFLTVVWGQAYIKRFASLSLPSYLAPGNLPALAEVTDLEVVIMTASKDIANFEKHEAFWQLRKICSVRFIEIDDLITTSIYGVTLTLAYARAVIACGADMIKTHFIFMNADFILADGSLRSLSKHILDGRSIVLGPSLRVTAEAMEPLLYSMTDKSTHTLVMAPRDMVRYSLENLHPTTLAKVVNQSLCHTINPNQFFWHVDRHTMLGRYHLIFMLCLKPERSITMINSYCDYGLIPEMCPSGDTAVMDDSDQFLMLELQLHEQEKSLLRVGRQSIRAAARRLGKWTTAEHRRSAKFDIVFHSQEIPSSLERFKNEANTFVSRIQKALPSPVPHAFHYHWVHGMQAWKYCRKAQGLSALPMHEFQARRKRDRNNIQDLKQKTSFFLNNLLSASHRKIIGSAPYITPLHPKWLDYRLLLDAVRAIPRDNATRLLVVSQHSGIVESLLNEHPHEGIISPKKILTGAIHESDKKRGPYTHIFIYLSSKDCHLMRQLIKRCQSLLQPDGECLVFLYHPYDGRNFSSIILEYIDGLVLTTMGSTEYYFVGGGFKSFNQNLFGQLKNAYMDNDKYALIWIIPALLPILLLSIVNNLYLRKKFPSNYLVEYCSSMLVRIKNRSGEHGNN